MSYIHLLFRHNTFTLVNFEQSLQTKIDTMQSLKVSGLRVRQTLACGFKISSLSQSSGF